MNVSIVFCKMGIVTSTLLTFQGGSGVLLDPFSLTVHIHPSSKMALVTMNTFPFTLPSLSLIHVASPSRFILPKTPLNVPFILKPFNSSSLPIKLDPNFLVVQDLLHSERHLPSSLINLHCFLGRGKPGLWIIFEP